MGKRNYGHLLLVLTALYGVAGCADDVVVPPDVERRSEALTDPLIKAIVADQEAAVLAALQLGSDPNQQATGELPPLHAAAKLGHVGIGRLLIKHNADVNLASESTVTDEEGLSIQRRGTTPLHVAVANNQLAFARMLISEQNVDVNSLDGRRQTPLDIATGKGVMLKRLQDTPMGRSADLETQIPQNQDMQVMLRELNGKTTDDIAREKIEQDVAANRDESFLNKTSRRLERSKNKTSRKDQDDDGGSSEDQTPGPRRTDIRPSTFPGLKPLEPLNDEVGADEVGADEVGADDESEE